MKSVAIAVACALLACGDTPRPVSHPKYGYFSGPTITGTVTSVTAGTGLTGGTITRSGTIAADTSVVQSRVSGTCTGSNAIQTVNADGTVTCVAAGGGGGGGSVTSVGTGTGLTGGPITTTGTIALANTAVTAGSYTLPAITVNAQGQLTAASSYAGTSCGAGTAIQLLSAAGAASCVTVGSGTVTSVATTAPITGGTITTGGTIGLSESSNLRTNAGALDLSTAVTMPGSLTVKDLAGTSQAISTTGLLDDVALGSSTTVIDYTGTADASWGGFVSTGDSRWIYIDNATTHVITLIDKDSSTTAADQIKVPESGSDGFQIPPNSGTWIHYDASSSLWRLSGLVESTCSAGQFIDRIYPDGHVDCSAPTFSGVTGSGTTGDLMKWSGSTAATNYAGSTPSACTAGSVTTQPTLSAAGAVANNCSTLGAVASSSGGGSTTTYLRGDGTWVRPLPDIDLDNGTNVGFFTGGANGPYFDANSLNFAYSNATDSTSWIDYNGALDGILHFRTLTIGNGKEAAIATFNGSSKLVEFFGAVNIDGAPTLGNGDATKVVGALSVYNNGTIPTISGCGTGATIASESSNNAGTITLGTTPGTCIVTFSAATGYTFTNAPACTVSPGSSAMKGGLYISISSTALMINGASLGASGDKIFYTCTGEKN